jgi:hypothetical protein
MYTYGVSITAKGTTYHYHVDYLDRAVGIYHETARILESNGNTENDITSFIITEESNIYSAPFVNGNRTMSVAEINELVFAKVTA